MPKIAWQTPVVLVLGVVSYAIVSLLDPGSAIKIAPEVRQLLGILAFAVTLAANQLKNIGGEVVK